MKILTVFFLIIMSNHSSANTMDDFKELCGNIDKVSNIMTPYLNMSWPGVAVGPSGPVPVVSTFIQSGRQPIADFCKFVKQMESLETLGQIHAATDYLNTLTDNQFKEDIDFALETLDVGLTLDKHLNGHSSANSESLSLHRNLNRYLRTQDEYFSKKAGNDATTFVSKQKRETQARRMITNSNKLANLKQGINCPKKTKGLSEEVMKIYEKKIYPLYILEDEFLYETKYHLGRLQAMGVKIAGDINKQKKYQKDLLNLFSTYAQIVRSPVKSKKTKVTKMGVMTSVSIPYYRYTSKINEKLLADFLKSYQKNWDFYLQYTMAQNPKLLTNREHSVNKEFRDLGYECRKSKLVTEIQRSNPRLRGKTPSDIEFAAKYETARANCRKGINVKKNYAGKLFTMYVNGLGSYQRSLKNTQRIIWNFESEEMGINRIISTDAVTTPVGDLVNNSAECSDALSPGAIESLKLEAANINTEARSEFAEQATISAIKYERELIRKKQERVEVSDRVKLNSEARERETGPIQMSIPKPEPGGF